MNNAKVSGSRYRQVKLVVTQQRNGRLDYSLYAKGLNAAWDEHTCLLRDSIATAGAPILTAEDALRAVVVVLSGQMLPAE